MSNSNNETPASESRRKLLKSLAAGGGVATTLVALPERWTRPVVDAVLIPAHAQTSIACNPSDLVEQILPIIGATLTTTATTVTGPITVPRTDNTFSGSGEVAAVCPGGSEPGTLFVTEFSGTIAANTSATANITGYLVCGGVTVCTLSYVLTGGFTAGADPDATYSMAGNLTQSCCPGYSPPGT